MHLVQTPGETVYEIKLTDLLYSVALEPNTFLKHFSSLETSVEVETNKTKTTTTKFNSKATDKTKNKN